MSAMEQGHVRMRLFGMQTTSFGKMEFATTEVMQSYCEERKEASRIRQINESGKKKKSRQETDAQTREEQISDLLLKRDALAERVKNAAPKSTTERLEAEYDTQLLEKLNDVLQTWMKAGGITESGKRVSGREKTKAMQHLSLAVESYEHYVKNRDMLIGGTLFEHIKKTDAYKEQYHEWTNTNKDDIVNLRTLISENGPYAPEKQKLITSIYGEYMQHSVAFADLTQEKKASLITRLELALGAPQNQQEESRWHGSCRRWTFVKISYRIGCMS